MTPRIRIVVRDRGLLATDRPISVVKPVKPVKPVQHVQPIQPPRSKRGDLAHLCQGVDIALEYFNSDSAGAISTLTAKARKWADKYFKGYPYAAKRPTALLRTFPNLFNLEIEAHLRLVPTVSMAPPSSVEPEGASPRDLRRAERRAMNSETFPEFAEPTLASEAELDQVVDLTRQRAKPTMRVDAAMLRGSGLLSTLPEFLGQLARANLEVETKLANDPETVRLELDEDQAAAQPHIEMNLFSGLIETQRRRHQRRIILPGGEPFRLPGDEEGASSEHEGSTVGKQSSSSDADESGDESDASTSTTASLRANRKKRKSAALEDADSAGETDRPNKIRLQYEYPPPELRRYDMKRRKLITRANPDAVPNDPFEAAQSDPARAAAKPPASCSSSADPSSVRVADTARPTSSGSSSSSSSSSSSAGRTPITKIRVPSRSPDGSRSASPDRIIILRHPVLPSSSSGGTPSSDESSGSQGSASSSAHRPRIKVLQKERKEQRDASPSLAVRKRLIQEVD
ncbi:hypothetical protein C8A03DRAFT_43423 [Achaetomium macrosporum]|uniref:Uncharacterized protein n=1 Tax=Achaetomium macrosporum TaxID=79813 RepID=A0AAN7HEI4_9PEZI|nr:hypothetical protein C8A03DRAFT_43423 [Achaetomium macrosporum]